MEEERIRFPSEKLDLEGLYGAHGITGAVAITHPHPLYGGDMYSPVVEAIESAYRQGGFTTLRFNFRGTGASTGRHDQGVGEQADVIAATDYLRTSGLSSIHLSGYSFGAWVNAMTLQNNLAVDGLTMVAPPVAFIEFSADIRLPCLSTVVAGSRDEFAPPGLIRPHLASWNRNACLDIIEGADHFFFGHLDAVARRLRPS